MTPDTLLRECARVRALIAAHHRKIGSPGALEVRLLRMFALATMAASLKAADQAALSGDTGDMTMAYEDLKGYTG